MSAQSATRRVWTTRLASSPPLSTVRLGPGTRKTPTRRVAHPRMPENEPARRGGAPTRVRSPRSPPRRPPPPPRRSSSSTGSSIAPRRRERSAPSSPTRTRATGRTRTRRRRPKTNGTRRVTRPRFFRRVGRSARRVCRAKNPGVRRRSRGWTKRRAPTRFAKPSAEKRSALCLSSPSSGMCCCAASRSKRSACSARGCTGCPPRRRQRLESRAATQKKTRTSRQGRFLRGVRFRTRSRLCSFLSRRLRAGIVPPR